MNYQVLDVEVKDTEETAKLYTYFLDNSREIAPERVRPVIVICPGGGYEWVSEREAEPIALKFVGAGYHAVVLHYSVAPAAHYPTALRQLAWTVAHLREPDCALSTSSISMHSGATEETRKATEKRLKNSM